jgi:hypothetical protein
MVKSNYVNHVILVILDDIRASHMFDLINAGKLPNIAKLAEGGIVCNNCVTSYPSITFPCYGNIMTGSYSGYFPKEGNAVPLYHWLDRMDPPKIGKKPPFYRNYSERKDVLKINRDIGKNVKTIFEQAGDGNFLASLSFLYRGAYFVVAENFSNVEPVFIKVEKAFKNPEFYFSNKEVPRVSVIYIPHTDELMHEKGFDHTDYIQSIVMCDRYLGSLIKTLKNTGYYDITAIGLITDHGNFKAKQVLNLESFFEINGLVPYNRKKGSGDFDVNFGSMGFFNFHGETWYHHPNLEQLENYTVSGKGKKKINLIKTLWNIPGVKLMYFRENEFMPDKGQINVYRKDEKTETIYKGKINYEGFGKEQKAKYSYEDIDIFGYESYVKETFQDKSFNIDEWLNLTNQIDFPMAIDQIPRYFKNPRSCDIVVSTLGNPVFNYEHGKTSGISPFSHDIGLRKSMIVPFIIGGSPEIPPKELSYCKTTDMVPTLLDLLGIRPHYSVVGKSVLLYK